jgi:periplasmic protein TonB
VTERARAPLALVLLLAGIVTARAATQDAMSAARDLYASAAYDESLAMLERLRTAEPATADVRTIEEYRAYCLMALGRTEEAQEALVRAISIDPAWEIPPGQLPPRIATMFASVREKTVPVVVRERLTAAKTLLAEKRHDQAIVAFTELLALLDNPSVAKLAGDNAADLKLVATGFLDLAREAKSLADARTRSDAPVQPTSGTLVATNGKGAQHSAPEPPSTGPGSAPATSQPPALKLKPEPRSSTPDAPPPAPNARSTAAAHTGGTTGTSQPSEPAPSGPPLKSTLPITLPTIISQQIPRPSGTIMPIAGPALIVLDILIDEFGRVERATVRKSVNKVYEAQLLFAARGWRYTPAMQGGKPVRYVKTIEITVLPR